MDLSTDRTIELGGRIFAPTPDDEIVFEQFAYIQTAAHEAGLGTELMEAYQPFVEELQNPDAPELDDAALAAISEKVVMRAFQDRAYLKVLAGVLVEEGSEWTLESAKANEEFFRRLKGQDIRKMHSVLTMATIGFFTSGLKSLGTSQSSSERRQRLEEKGIDVDSVTLSPKRTISRVTALGGEADTETTVK